MNAKIFTARKLMRACRWSAHFLDENGNETSISRSLIAESHRWKIDTKNTKKKEVCINETSFHNVFSRASSLFLTLSVAQADEENNVIAGILNELYGNHHKVRMTYYAGDGKIIDSVDLSGGSCSASMTGNYGGNEPLRLKINLKFDKAVPSVAEADLARKTKAA